MPVADFAFELKVGWAGGDSSSESELSDDRLVTGSSGAAAR